MIRPGIGLAALILATASGCGDGPLSPSQRLQLAEARARWADGGSGDYTVEGRISCFCPSHLLLWTRLTVRAGQIVAAEPVEPPPDGIEPSLLGWRTVEEAFGMIEGFDSSVIRSVKLRFDSELGYPLEIRVTCHSNITDCGVVEEMRNLRFP